jgi:hippurate hydrolase
MEHRQRAYKSLRELKDELVKLRRDLHRIPELDRDLPKTEAYIKDYLAGLPCEIIPAGDSGFCAFFKAKGDVETVAFRSDMDALPIDEANDVDYRSVHDGRMHACGHDGHMSILLGLATEAAKDMDALQKSVLLIFQGAEETTGGAKQICESGVLERCGVARIYGLHLWPGYPKGMVICRNGAFMASTLVFRVEIKGKSVHVGTYRDGIDALEVGCALVNRFYAMEKEAAPPEVFRLLRFGVFESGRATNIVPGHALLEGTLRTYSKDIQDSMWGRMREIADELTRDTGAEITFSHSDPYPAVVNDAALFDDAKAVLKSAGYDFFEPETPIMISEDFSWYQQYVPGLFFHLGTGMDTPLHNANYQIDEDVLPIGVDIFKRLLKGNTAR